MKKLILILISIAVIATQAAHAGNSLSKAAYNGNLKNLQALIAEGEGVNEYDKWGWTPLLWSVFYKNIDIIKYLLEKGANPDIASQMDYRSFQTGTTALMLAITYDQRDTIELLMQKKPNLELATRSGKKTTDFIKEYDLRAGPDADGKLLADFISRLAGESAAVAAAEVIVEKPIVVAVAVPPPAVTARTKKIPVLQAAPVKAKKALPPVINITSPQIQRGVNITAKEAYLTVTGKAVDASGIAEVTVNGQSADLDESGNFSAEILLKVGNNKITVTALGVNKNVATESFSLMRSPGVIAKPKSIPPPEIGVGGNYALVIGINNYKHMDGLKTAVNDAMEIGRVLADQYGFETRLLLDEKATSSAIMKELNVIRAKLKPSDKLIVYYAGHGILDKQTDASYWLAVDAELNDDTNWLDTKRISDQLKRITARQVLVIADSCYSGSISRGINVDLQGNDSRDNYLKKLQEKPSRILIASGGNEPVADGGENGHSIFADVFIKALSDPRQPSFTANELVINQVREAVSGKASQTPECKIIRNSGHDSGDFVFQKKK